MANNIMLSTTVSMNTNPLERSVGTAKAELKSLNKALNAQSKAFKGAEMDAKQLADREKILTQAIEAQQAEVKQKKAAYDRAVGSVKDLNNMTNKEINSINRAKGAYSEAQYALKKYENNLSGVAAQQIRAKNSTSGLDSEMSQMRNNTARAVSMFKQMGNETGALKAQYKGLGQQINVHGRKLDQEKRSLQEIKSQMGSTSAEYKQQQQVVDRLNDEHAGLINQQSRVASSMNKVKGATDKATRNYAKLGDTWKRVGNGMRGVGQTMTASITLPVTVGLGMAIKKSMDFEGVMSKVGAVSGATGKQMQKMKDQAIDLGAKTSLSASEVSEGMLELSKKGFTANQTMKAMPGIISAAEASGASMADTSNVMASAIRGFGLEAKDSGHVADVLAEAANKSSADIGDMGQTFKYVAPIAKTLGMSLEDTSAASMVMADAGIDASSAGTSMRMSLLRMAKPTAKGKAEMDKLGVSLTDAEGNFVGLPKLIGQFQEGLKGMTKEQKLATISNVVGTEASSAFLTLVDAGPKKLDKYSKSLKDSDGASAKAAKQMKDNLKGSVEQLGGAFESLGLIIGDALTPMLRWLADAVSWLVDKISGMPKWLITTITVMALLAAAIGPVLVGIGALVASIGAIMGSTAIMGVLSAIAGAIGAISLPVVAAVAGIAALIGVLAWLNTKIKPIDWGPIFKGIWTWIQWAWGQITGFFSGLGTRIMSGLATLGAWLRPYWSGFWNGLVGIVRLIGGKIASAFSFMWTGLLTVLRVFGGVFRGVFLGIWNGIVNVAKFAMTGLSVALRLIWTGIVNVARYIFGGLRTFFVWIWNSIKGVILPIVRFISNTIKIIWNGLSTYFRWVWGIIKGIFSWGAQAIKVVVLIVFAAISKFIKFIFNGIKSFLTWIWRNIKIGIMFYVNLIRKGVTIAWTALSKVTRVIFNAVRNFAVFIWTNIKNRVVALARGLWSIVRGVWNVLSKVSRAIFSNLRNFVVAVWTNLRNRVVAFTRSLWNIVRGIWNTLSKVSKSIFSNVRNFLVAVWTNLRNRVVAFTRSLWNIVRGIWNTLSKVTRNIFNSVRNFLVGIWTTIRNKVAAFARSLWSKVSGTWNSLFGGTKNIFNKVRNYLVDKWQGIKNKVTDIVSGLWGSVKKTFTNMKDGIKGLAGKIGDTINGMVKGIKKGLNALIKGVNWVAKKLGVDQKIPTLSTGTGGASYTSSGVGAGVSNGVVSSGGFATVNDRGPGNGTGASGHQEVIQKADGTMIAPKGRDITVPLGKGDIVHNGRTVQKAQKAGLFPKFSKGTGADLFKGAKKHKKDDEIFGDVAGQFNLSGGGKLEDAQKWLATQGGKLAGKNPKATKKAAKIAKPVADAGNWIKDKAGDLLDWVGKPGKLVDKILKEFGVNFPKITGQIPKDMMWDPMWKTLKNATKSLFDGWLTEADAGGDGGYIDLSKGINFPFSPHGRAPGYPFAGPHMGVDLNYKYDKLYSVLNGKATARSGWNGGFGNMVDIVKGNLKVIYGHMSKHAFSGSKQVKPGDYLGVSGNSGRSSGPHLHFEVQKNGTPIDPIKWLKQNDGGGSGSGKWKSTVKKALKLSGLPTSGKYVNAWLKQIQTESGGNAKALGGTDGLADGRAKGLVQVKPGTFNAYKLPGHGNIWKGLDNLIAGMRYANAKYGNAGLGVIGKGHGYAVGTNNARAGLANVFEKGGEIMNLRGGEQIIPNDVSIAALRQIMSSNIFDKTQQAVFAGISRYADALRNKEETARIKQLQAQQQANANTTDINELKAMMADMVYLMQKQLGVQEDISRSNNAIANNPINLDGQAIAKNTSEQEAFNLLMRNYNSGITNNR